MVNIHRGIALSSLARGLLGLLGLLEMNFVSLRHEGHRHRSAYPVKDVSGVGSRVVDSTHVRGFA